MKEIIAKLHNAAKKRMIEDSYIKLASLFDAILDKLDASAYQHIYPELIDMTNISKLIGMLEILEETNEENDFDEEDYECYEGVDNND